MAGKLLVMKNVTTAHISSVTNEGEPAISDVIPADGNLGGVKAIFDSPSSPAVSDYISELLLDGDIGETCAKVSVDGGSNYRARNQYNIANTRATVLSVTNADAAASSPIVMDTNGDGFPDTVFVAIQDRDHASVRLSLHSSTDLTATGATPGSFSSVSTILDNSVASADISEWNPALVADGDRITVFWGEGQQIKAAYSTDYGVTWSAAVAVATPGYVDSTFDIKPLHSGGLGIVYSKQAGTYKTIVYATSISGLNFTDISTVSSGSNDRTQPTFCERRNGDLYCYNHVAAGGSAGIYGRYSTDGGLTWADEDRAIPTATTHTQPHVIVTPLNDMWLFYEVEGSGNDWVTYKYFNSQLGEWTQTEYSALEGDGIAANYSDKGRAGIILGERFLMFTQDFAGTVTIQCSYAGYWAAYSAPTVSDTYLAGSGLNDLTGDVSGLTALGASLNLEVEIDSAGTPDTFRWRVEGAASWVASGIPCTTTIQELAYGIAIKFGATTGHDAVAPADKWRVAVNGRVGYDFTSEEWQYVPDGSSDIYYRYEGSAGGKTDSFTTTAAPRYPKERAILGDPKWRLRSTGDNAVFRLVLNFGANTKYPADMFAFLGHAKAVQIPGHTADDWVSPSFTDTLALTKETIDVAEGEIGAIYRANQGMTPHEYADGKHWLYGTDSGLAYEIWDNDATRIYVKGKDFTSGGADDEDGNELIVVGDRAWSSFSQQLYRFYAVEIDAHHTANNYYDFIFFLGTGLSLARDGKKPGLSQAVSIRETPAGGVVTNKIGEPRLDYQLTLYRIGSTHYEEVKSLLVHNDMGAKPLVYIPDDSVATDFRIVIPANQVQFDATRTVINLRENI